MHEIRSLAARVVKDTRGATAIEFAAIAPALLMTLLALMDFSYNLYTTAVLEGAIQAAARDSSLETASATSIDTRIRERVGDIVPNGTVGITRRAYTDFSDVHQAEDYTDSNGDGLCGDGEPFEDANGNGTWDADRGTEGPGGARDAVLLTVTVTYPRAFPLMGLIGLDETIRAEARTVLRNQPFGEQDRSVEVENCE